jgi:hypothetical protein
LLYCPSFFVVKPIKPINLQSNVCNSLAPPSVVSGYGKRSINLNKVVATFEKHIFLSQTDLTRTGIISNNYNDLQANFLDRTQLLAAIM